MNKLAILGLLRHLLTFGAGYLVSKGLLDEGSTQEVVGGLLGLIGAVWSWLAPEKKV